VIVADTHAWIWWISQPDVLSDAAAEAMGGDVGVAAISCWEVALLAQKGRIALETATLEWLLDATEQRNVAVLTLTPRIAARAAALPDSVGRDPADRLIIATALEYGVPLVTKDGRITDANVVETIW
jgi:PIN domain nuclease of toxin-antitoxin system